ncbi:MAG: hypothetical protein NVSMB30_13150 [Hymenobacter sp.]
MKNLFTALLPALALFALGGCAGTSALTSSEDDGVYYSSKDRTTAVVSTAPAPASTNEAANPDYNSSPASAPARRGSSSDQYYDNSYSYMRGVPRYGGMTAYVPYSPYTSLSYGIGSYGWGGGYCGYSPYGFYDPFYSPFYSPFGYGSGVSISIGIGRPWGYGGYGYGYGRPYGYGAGFYDPYYYSSPYYGGYYGRGGYYGGGNYGSSYGYGNNSAYYGNDNPRYRTSGHRDDRASDGRYSSGSVAAPATGGSVTGGGRVRSDDRLQPGDPMTQPAAGAAPEGRMRNEGVTSTPMGAAPTRAEDSYNQPRRQPRAEQPVYRDMAQPNEAGQVTREENRGRWRNPDAAPQREQMESQPAAAPQEGQRRRGGFFQNVFSEPANTAGQAADQPRQQRSYEQPRQQRTYEQPQHSYEQPQQRSYSQPSYSAPSYGGGGGGGGGHSRGRAD